MANGRTTAKKNPNHVDVLGAWFGFPLDFLKSRACAELSPLAIKMLIDLCAQFGRNAKNNGDLSAAPAVMAPRGWTSVANKAAALRELIDAEVVIVTRPGTRKLCSLYAVTLFSVDCDQSKLAIGPGAYSKSDWERDKSRTERPTLEKPAKWKSARKGEPRKSDRKQKAKTPPGTECAPTRHASTEDTIMQMTKRIQSPNKLPRMSAMSSHRIHEINRLRAAGMPIAVTQRIRQGVRTRPHWFSRGAVAA